MISLIMAALAGSIFTIVAVLGWIMAHEYLNSESDYLDY